MSGTHVRCAFCPNATAAVAKVSRGACVSCAPRVASHRSSCPDCGGVVMIDVAAENAHGHQVTVAFCTECEFCLEVQ